ncbi:gpi anchored cell wall [Trichoderma arundinaceum]|uniref:Gpi anchored cell wall n=1 Tax=Trichoderma arundinaceum TaxID=490622 RepID=A0A395NP31_TRIAR|nr:gpi anchored cell wall [Trichoderma arundinaceum]
MLYPILALGLGAAVTEAAVARNYGCQLHLTASGAISGPVGEIWSGQVRAGSGVSSTTFTLQGSQLWDDKGRGCWWTRQFAPLLRVYQRHAYAAGYAPPTHVLQCDKNQRPDDGFKVACDGCVSYNGQTEFWECQTGENGQYNVYLTGGQGVNCNKITLKSDSCRAECPPPPPPPPPPPQPPKTCPANLNRPYEFPHLIIPVDKTKPNNAPGTSFFGEVSNSVSSIFNFDIPNGDKGKKCSLVFLFPQQKDLQTSSFTFSGSGALDFAWLSKPASQGTTFNNQPGTKRDFGVTTVSPGHSYVISTFDCPAGQAIAFKISAANGGGTSFRYFQDYNPAPIGLYITKC